jgi:hypothetical protein
MTLDDFEKQVILACMQSPVITSVAVSGTGVTWVRLRAHLEEGRFKVGLIIDGQSCLLLEGNVQPVASWGNLLPGEGIFIDLGAAR